MSAVLDTHPVSHQAAPEASERCARFLQRVSTFCRDRISPRTAEWDRREELPRELFSDAGGLGLMGMLAPGEFGGQELDFVTYVRAVMEVSRHDAAFGMWVAAHNALNLGQILRYGSESQRRRWVPGLASGALLGAWALTEPNAGSDAAGSMETRATPDGTGWRLGGRKMFITGGNRADVVIVMAVSGRLANGRNEISSFLVERAHVTRLARIPTLGMRASDTAEIAFEDAPAELLGERGEGQRHFLELLDRGRVGIAALGVGIGRAAVDELVSWAAHRRQFGKALSEHQLVQAMIADSATEVDAAELLTLRAATLQRDGLPSTRESSMAKLFAGESASRAANRAVQVHGGRGYSRDFRPERLLRDAKLCEIGEGASEIQRLVIARQVLRAASTGAAQ